MRGTLAERTAALRQLYPVWKKGTIYQFFEDTVSRFPENDFLVQENGPSYTYEQAMVKVREAAGALLAAGIGPGDHVAVQMTNCGELCFLYLALARIGAVKIPVNIALGCHELYYVLDQSDARFFISAYPVRFPDGKCPGSLEQVILAGGSFEGPEPKTADLSELMERGQKISGDVLDRAVAGAEYGDRISDIIYTSGSTGAPKGAMLTHDMLMRSAYANCLNRGFEPGRRVYVPLPLFHSYGYVEGFLAVILVGGAILFRREKFSAPDAVRFMKEARANDILSVPSLMMKLIGYLKENPMELEELHAVYCSATACPAWVWDGIRRYLQVDDVITGYGMTEVCGASMQTLPSDGDERLLTCVGRLLPGGCSGAEEYGGYQLAYRVVDPDTGEDCSPGVAGELICRGLTVAQAYYNNPDVNQWTFRDGWFHTSDLGHFDGDGYLRLSGRIDDIYKINGENVSPKFLEDILGNCGLIGEAVIVGVPCQKYGAVGVAFLQLKEDSPENRRAAERFCQENLAQFQIPKYYFYMNQEDWPMTSTGKIQRFRLKEMAREILAGERS